MSTPIEANINESAHRACPACGDETRKLLYQQKFSRLSQNSMLPGYDVVICQNCGCGYADAIPGQSWFDAYYRDLSKYEFQQREGQESPFDTARFHDIADYLVRFIPDKTSHILDFGCATGGLLYQLKERGFQNVLGLDPSPGCAAAAEKLYGVRVVNPPDASSVNAPEIEDNSFDFVILNAVLEHLEATAPVLQKLRSLLKDGGQIFVEVPDATGFADLPDAPYQQFSTEHVNFFSPVSLRRIMARNGFEAVDVMASARDQSFGTVMPVTFGIFRKAENVATSLETDTQTAVQLQRYIEISAEREKRVEKIIEELAKAQTPIVVWGVGTHTLHLLETTRLKEASIAAFLDSNVRYAGQELNGVPIIASSELPKFPQPVLISSRVFQKEIEEQIKNVLRCDNELIRLYDV